MSVFQPLFCLQKATQYVVNRKRKNDLFFEQQ